jgi:hypothetical protein
MISYSQIAKNKNTQTSIPSDTPINTPSETNIKIEKQSSNVVFKYHDQIMLIKPYSKNIYSKSETYKWLHHKIDNNYFHYDYCVKLFGILMKWIKLNNFKLAISEDILLAKFISLMYLLSNKQGYD